MAITLTDTKASSKWVKMLNHAPAGYGKTELIHTAPEPVIISAEAGLLSLAKHKPIKVLEIETIDDVYEAYELVTGKKGKIFQTICLDSISDIAEVCLEKHMEEQKHDLKAYALMANELLKLLRAFRDIKKKHVYMTSKTGLSKEDENTGRYVPATPGQKLARDLPYMFDLVTTIRLVEKGEGKQKRYLQCQPDYKYEAKDRSGKLDKFEPMNLTKLFKKIIS